MAVALPIEPGGDVVDSADDMDVVSHWQQRSQTRRQFEIGPRSLWNPVALRNAISVEPDEEPGFDRLDAPGLTRSGVSRTVEIEHRGERRKSDPYQRSSNANSS